LSFIFPSLSPDQLEFGNVVCRKSGHMLEYFILGIFTWRAVRRETRDPMKVFVLSAVVVLMVALSDEFHQSFVPSRTSSVIDVGYDFIGGVAALSVLSRFRNENRAVYSHTVL
jgi:VanZ family protein